MSTPFDSLITFLPTTDLESTARFYEKILQLELALDQTTCRIYRVASDGYLGFCQKKQLAEQQGLILTLVSEDVDGWYQRLLDAGIEIEHAPAHNPQYKIYHFFFRDPNGYRLEIQRFEDSRWD